MADCTAGVAANIVSNCTTQRRGGIEVLVYLYNRKDHTVVFDVTNPSKITSITNASGKNAYTITGVKRNLNAGSSRVQNDNADDTFAHRFNFSQFEVDATNIENVDNLRDFFVVVERLDTPTDDGKFAAYGVKHGLYPSSDERDENENLGARIIEAISEEGGEEPWSVYTVLDTDATTTSAMLAATLTPGV